MGTPKGFVVKAQNFIIMAGPIARTRSIFSLLSSISFRGSVTTPLRAYDPSSVVTINSSLTLCKRSSQKSKSLLRAPSMEIILFPACFRALAIGNTGAAPTPPATQTTVPNLSMSEGKPKGPTRFNMESPASRQASLCVEVPTCMATRVIVPSLLSQSASVSGIRSPTSSTRITTNWPGLAFLATAGASTSM